MNFIIDLIGACVGFVFAVIGLAIVTEFIARLTIH